jgi:hypothetical protein
MMDIIIETSRHTTGLQARVRQRIAEEGYQPLGGVSFGDGEWAMALGRWPAQQQPLTKADLEASSG